MVIGFASRPFRGEVVCGDKHLVIDGDSTIVALADGLGHGPKAEVAADAFCDVVRKYEDRPLAEIMSRCTREISSTRGVAAAIVRIDQSNSHMVFCGIGNIEFRAISASPIRPICLPGIVGRPVRKIREFEFSLASGDLLLMHSDGISTQFDLEEFAHLAPEPMAEEILNRHGKYHDDATCVVIRIDS